MAVLDDIGAFLDAQLGSLTLGTNLFLARLPDDPDTCVAVFEYVGEPPVETMNGTSLPLVEQPRIQVVTRAAGYSSARTLALTIWTELETLVNTTAVVAGDTFLRMSALQSPFALERDSVDRILIAQNFRVQKTT